MMVGRRYQCSFLACVDKYDKMSSWRDSGGCGGFLMIIVCPLSCNELLQSWAGRELAAHSTETDDQ